MSGEGGDEGSRNNILVEIGFEVSSMDSAEAVSDIEDHEILVQGTVDHNFWWVAQTGREGATEVDEQEL